MKTIKIDSKDGYLNIEALPKNCIFNKKVTGCGGTSIAIFGKENYVISVPTTELITNKTGLNEAGVGFAYLNSEKKNIFGLFGTNPWRKELKQYLKLDNSNKVIMCTYDKTAELTEWLDNNNMLSEFNLLVDEYQCLLKDYSYRKKAIDGVINNFRRYKSFCFMSATPISPEFTPSVLEGIELVEADWEEVDLLAVKLDQTNKPYVMASNYINAYKRDGFVEINGNKSYEAFFFVNSVTDIASILKYCNLSNDEVKIVCADNKDNRKKLAGYTISNSKGENKKFTFITRKSFEGADYFSETGLCFVVSNSRNTYTLLDISTDIYQIAGRIRTESNPFRNIMIHIFNTVGRRKLNTNKSWEDMVADTNKEIEGANKMINLLNNDEAVRKAADKIINSEYITEDKDGKFYLNDMLVKLCLYTYKIEQVIYKSGIAIRKEYSENRILTDKSYTGFNEKMDSYNKKMSFKDAFIRYAELLHKLDVSFEAEEIAKIQPLVVPAFHKLGEDKVKSLRYVKKAIEEAIENADSNKSNEARVAAYLGREIPVGFITNKSAKDIISKAYQLYGIKKSGKATDLDNWFNCKAVSKRIDNKVVRGYEIYSSKLIYNGRRD